MANIESNTGPEGICESAGTPELSTGIAELIKAGDYWALSQLVAMAGAFVRNGNPLPESLGAFLAVGLENLSRALMTTEQECSRKAVFDALLPNAKQGEIRHD